VTYIVWIGSQPQTSFTLQQGPKAITSPLYTSQTDQIEDDFSLYITNPPTSGLWVMVTQPSSGFVVGASLEPYTGPDAVVGLMLKSPAQLGSGFFNGSVAFEVCYDSQCQNPVQGSPVIEPLTFLVSLTSGHEFDLKTVGIPGVTDVAWNAANQQLYATTVAAYGSPASLVAVDPVAGTVGASLSFGPDLYQVALSDDGQYGYVASRDQPIVYRIQFPAFVSDLQIPLGSPLVGASSFANSVFQMQVAPGSPQTLAVSFAQAGSTDYTSGVAVFDGATERANLLPKLEDFGTPADIAWGASASILYAVRDTEQLPADLRELDIVNADTNGLSVGTTFPISLADPLGDIWYAGGRIYGTDGNVRDPSTNTILAQYVVPSGYQLSTLVPDPANGRLFVLVHGMEDSRLLLLCYDASTLALRSVTDLGFDETIPYPLHLITWGTDGIAFTSGEGSLVVFSGSFQSSASSGPSEIKKSATLRLR
jgi:DNA-binding beta-propeller fold protein YncE